MYDLLSRYHTYNINSGCCVRRGKPPSTPTTTQTQQAVAEKITATLYCEAVNAFGAAAPLNNARCAATKLPYQGGGRGGWWFFSSARAAQG
jgi:hypothetical protein